MKGECVQCGYCCTVAPCPFGEWDGARCAFLTAECLCSRYEEILGLPGAEVSPAFGSGCCAPLFNEVREAKMRRNP